VKDEVVKANCNGLQVNRREWLKATGGLGAGCVFFRAALLLATCVSAVALGQGSAAPPESPPTAAPLYRVSFERGDAVSGISATPAIKLPFECTSDGTIYVTFGGTVSAGSGIVPPLFPPMLLTSISPAGHGQVFRLDQVPDLYFLRELDHYASDSEVTFLVRASRENKPVKKTYSMKDGSRGEYTGSAAEQRLYILSFNRGGEYRRTIEIENTFGIERLGIFPSGTFLAFGFDEKDNSPKLVMLKEDGTFLKSLQIPRGGVPDSLVGAANSTHPYVVAPAQLVPEGRSILVVLNNSTFPLLEVSEGGAIRAIHPRLPKGEQIEAAIPADRNLYVIARPETAERESAGVIYEVSPEDGAVLRRFELSDGRSAPDVACAHDGKFLSIDYRDGKVVPLIGSAEPSSAVDQKKP
jgi:hypothetical protein